MKDPTTHRKERSVLFQRPRSNENARSNENYASLGSRSIVNHPEEVLQTWLVAEIVTVLAWNMKSWEAKGKEESVYRRDTQRTLRGQLFTGETELCKCIRMSRNHGREENRE